jgi:transcriptional regulator with XRE-family HTH domain
VSEIYKRLGKRIKHLRELTGMTQEELSKKLKISRPTTSQIEKGERRIPTDELMKLSEIFDVDVNELLELERAPEVILEKGKKRKKVRPEIRINVPQKNLEKFKQVLLYILNKVGSKPNIGMTVIYKLLYFIDFNYYEKYEEQLIGATYIKNQYGPTPVEFQKIVKEMIKEKEVTKVKDQYFKYPQTKYLPLKKADLSGFSANEIRVIDKVLEDLSDKNAKEISEYSHNDVPWLTTDDGAIIEYESVFYRTAPYSVRKYDEDIR